MSQTIEYRKEVTDAMNDPFVVKHAAAFMVHCNFAALDERAFSEFERRQPNCLPDDFDSAVMLRVLAGAEEGRDGTI